MNRINVEAIICVSSAMNYRVIRWFESVIVIALANDLLTYLLRRDFPPAYDKLRKTAAINNFFIINANIAFILQQQESAFYIKIR